MNPKVLTIDYHRNGIGGEGFVAATVEWNGSTFVAVARPADRDDATPEQLREEMRSSVAVLSVPLLADPEVGAKSGFNSWRGADYVGPAVVEAWHERCISREGWAYCPFDDCHPTHPDNY